MKIDLKTIVLLSALVAVGLNICQFIDSALQQREAFAPAWAAADKTTPSPQPAGSKRSPLAVTPSPTPTPASAAAPAPDPVAAAAAKLTAAGLNPAYAALYVDVQSRTGTPWQLLAAIHKVETNQRGDTAVTSSAGATGPMQFMPATWRSYAADGDRNGTTDIHDVDDAMLTAGRYLAANGAARGQYGAALYRYNHSSKYVATVTGIATRLGL